MSQVKIIKINEPLKKIDFKYLSYLPKESIDRINRYKRYEDAYRSYLGELLRRQMISSFLHCGCKNLEFYHNEYGKPFVKTEKDCYFSISHSGSYVVGIIDNSLVGIDIEKVERTEDDLPICYMHEKEIKKINSFSEPYDICNYFYFLWTMKEAYLKGIGTGLSKKLSSFWVEKNDKNGITIEDGESSLYHFNVLNSINVDADYVLSTVGNSKNVYHYISDTEFLAKVGKKHG